ncbi:MAG: hypothetical protein H6540_04875 [Bacteroidales bacterium]|nr:hypothetical protein [Bacteroidales bacterium]
MREERSIILSASGNFVQTVSIALITGMVDDCNENVWGLSTCSGPSIFLYLILRNINLLGEKGASALSCR